MPCSYWILCVRAALERFPNRMMTYFSPFSEPTARGANIFWVAAFHLSCLVCFGRWPGVSRHQGNLNCLDTLFQDIQREPLIGLGAHCILHGRDPLCLFRTVPPYTQTQIEPKQKP